MNSFRQLDWDLSKHRLISTSSSISSSHHLAETFLFQNYPWWRGLMFTVDSLFESRRPRIVCNSQVFSYQKDFLFPVKFSSSCRECLSMNTRFWCMPWSDHRAGFGIHWNKCLSVLLLQSAKSVCLCIYVYIHQTSWSHDLVGFRIHPDKSFDEMRPLMCGPRQKGETKKKDLSEVWEEACMVVSPPGTLRSSSTFCVRGPRQKTDSTEKALSQCARGHAW